MKNNEEVRWLPKVLFYGIFSALAVMLLGLRISGFPYVPLYDQLLNLSLGLIGEKVIRSFLGILLFGERKLTLLSVGSIEILAAVKETIDALPAVKQNMPGFLRWAFNGHSNADPLDFGVMTFGALLGRSIDYFLTEYIEPREPSL